ncbi:hypothetical protein D9758_006117 [Tetrapyrgos nigripes]|uniref:Uncharacterized protein n=1 Tax=Tetrapyrgos nigripes TaxID=182062 RepID=A0A8H5G0B1_9AGAR|nr:hypothetical protein D9758_006117 [Tetrapyrgos nigripes]
MALDQSGSKLALLTRTSSENFLRLYEAQNSKMSRSTSHTVTLMPSQVHGLPLEVSTAAFSPDGIYIAVARRDNRTHVYDSRYLDRLLYDFRHSGRSRASPGHDSYGVTQVEWTQSPLTNSLGLITGGMDGMYI